MENEQTRYSSYEEVLKEIKEKYGIEIGNRVLIPAFNGRKQKKRFDYGEMVGAVMKQSGDLILLFKQRNKRLLFTIGELAWCWDRASAQLPRVRQ